MQDRSLLWMVLGALLLTPGTVFAQQRPLVTEDPETIGSGNILVEVGFDQLRHIEFPVAGLAGNLLRLPTFGVSFGISSIAEIQIDGGFYNRLNVTRRYSGPLSSMLDFSGDTTTDVEDVVVATKVRVVSEKERRPAIGVRFATKLPNASNESGLGLDTTDFYAGVLVGKTVQSVRFVGNVGLAILGDPTRGDRQNDTLNCNLSIARAVAQGVEVVGEADLRIHTREASAPPGTGARGALRGGARFTRGPVRLDGGLSFGLSEQDAKFGVTAGLTWVFRAFTIP
ncbi:MAG TPA: transporter [Vicinamibacterales bacterium]|nr:transporter [Vicinamibacterales bacterium]